MFYGTKKHQPAGKAELVLLFIFLLVIHFLSGLNPTCFVVVVRIEKLSPYNGVKMVF